MQDLNPIHAQARAEGLFIKPRSERTLHPLLSRMILRDILDAGDREYFRSSREQRFGKTLEAIVADRDATVTVRSSPS